MGESGNIDLPGGSFSRLLLSIDDDINNQGHNDDNNNNNNLLFSSNTPKMLCFGDFGSQFSPSVTSSSSKRRNGSGQESELVSGNGQKSSRKKNKADVNGSNITVPSTVGRHGKRKKEKLGERILTLQKLVCPYGKTDTASVLHEAIGYIRFLHEQVKVHSSPYFLHTFPPPSSPSQHFLSLTEKSAPKTYETQTKCLRSQGLCLVPVDSIMIDLANSNNGADFWSSSTNLTSP